MYITYDILQLDQGGSPNSRSEEVNVDPHNCLLQRVDPGRDP